MSKSKIFTFLLIFLSFSAIFSFYNFDSASAQGVTWSFNSTTNTATASGTGSTNFAALVAADVAGGWGVYTADATGNVIMCRGKVYIGDGTNATVLTDTSKQIIFSNGLGSNFLRVQANSTLTLGVLDNAAQYRTSRGCSLCYYDTTNTRGQMQGSGTVNLYGCHIFSNNPNAYQGLSLYAIGTLIVYNCVFSRALIQEANANTQIFNTQFMRPPFGAVIFTGTPALFSKVSVTDSGESVIYSYRNVTALNPYGRNCVYTAYLNANNHNISINLVNPDIDNRHFFFTGAYVAGSRINEQYEFDLNVLNGEITDFVQNANVTLYKDGSKIYSALTNSSGMIPTQTLTYGYYQKATGDTIQNATSPYYLVISHPDWQTYVSRFYITQPLRLTVSMQEPTYTGYTEVEKSDYTTIILFVISLILCIIGLALTVPLLPLIALTVSVINVLLLTEISVFNILLIILNIIFTVITIVRTKTKNN